MAFRFRIVETLILKARKAPMRSDDTSTIYTVSEELTDRLIELMDNAE